MVRKLLALTALSTLCSLALAEKNDLKAARSVTQIFSQLVTFSFPNGFVPALEDAKDGQYIQESVLKGESLKNWSQMITVTGVKDMALSSKLTPTQFAGSIAGGFEQACSGSYTATGLGETKFSSHDAFAAVVSCGIANPAGKPYSEAMLLIVIKGTNDYYTIQWAERGDASKTPIKFDSVKWTDRLKKLKQ